MFHEAKFKYRVNNKIEITRQIEFRIDFYISHTLIQRTMRLCASRRLRERSGPLGKHATIEPLYVFTPRWS